MTVQDTSPKQVWAGATVRQAFDKFQTGDLAFTLAGAPGGTKAAATAS